MKKEVFVALLLFHWMLSSACAQDAWFTLKDANLQTMPGTHFVFEDQVSWLLKGCPQGNLAMDALRIADGTSLVVDSQTALCVNGQLQNPGGIDGLILQSDATGSASFIHHDNGVYASIQRHIPAVDDWHASPATDWRMISTPVDGQEIAGFIPCEGHGDFDFYGWSEEEQMWKNYKQYEDFLAFNDGPDFNPGQGYLVAYEESQDFVFQGRMAVEDVWCNNLTHSWEEPYGGWHLLGNPYAAAIDWNNPAWDRPEVLDEVHVWHPESGNYISNLNGIGDFDGIIRPHQAMFIKTNGPNKNASLQFPAEARMHAPGDFFRKTRQLPFNTLRLEVRAADDSARDAAYISFADDADPAFDPRYDAHHLQGAAHAPGIYTRKMERKLSIAGFDPSDQTTVPLWFNPGDAQQYTLNVAGVETTLTDKDLFLKDLHTGYQYDLRKQPEISFVAADMAGEPRFVLIPSDEDIVVDDPCTGGRESIIIYSHKQHIHITLPAGQSGEARLLSADGRIQDHLLLPHDGPHVWHTRLPGGVYVVEVTTGEELKREKVIISK